MLAEYSAITLLIAALGLVVILALFYLVIPMKMARKRGRSALAAVLLCFILSPVIVYLMLLLMGPSADSRRQSRRKRPRR